MDVRFFQKRGTWYVDIRAQGLPRQRLSTGETSRMAAEKAAPALVARALENTMATPAPNRPANSRGADRNVIGTVGPTLREAFKAALTSRPQWMQSKDKASLEVTYRGLGHEDDTPLAVFTFEYVKGLRAKWAKSPGKRRGTLLAPSTVNGRLSMLSVLLEAAEMAPHGVKHLSVRGNERTRRIDQNDLRLIEGWAAMREEIGYGADQEFVFHALRHEALSRLADQEANAFVMQAIAGHSNIVTTQRYVKASQGAMRKALSSGVQSVSITRGDELPINSTDLQSVA